MSESSTFELLDPNEVVRMLPTSLRETIRRKSSRDPSSRFSRKLHALLSYVSANPEMEEQIGIGWLDDQVFQVCKKRLLEIMGIKLNTLNVNFHQLRFVQLQCDRQGWTRWRRDGFTRQEIGTDNAVSSNNHNNHNDSHHSHNLNSNSSNSNSVNSNELFDNPRGGQQHNSSVNNEDEENIELKLGHVTEEQINVLTSHVQIEWQEITGGDKKSVAANFFISKVASKYKQPQQEKANAYDVMKAIFAPHSTESIKFSAFYRFLAMFGPAETVMLKIHSLLEVATAGTPWLYFGLLPSSDFNGFYGHFDENEPNCLVLHNKDGTLTHVYNLPLVPSGESYIVNTQGTKYDSWEHYFQENPVPNDESFTEHDINSFVS